MATRVNPVGEASLLERLRATRQLTLDLAAPLSDADATIQPNPDASPAKWHLAHTTWFFETFVLRDHLPGYSVYDERYAYLFNSYYEGEGERHPRPKRGMLSRPSLNEVRAWRAHVDEALNRISDSDLVIAGDLLELGLNHEQQHQELLLTDILASFAENPLDPAYGDLAGEMASRPHYLVFRDLRAARSCAGLQAVRRALPFPVQQLLRRRGRPAPTAAAWHADPAVARRNPHLARACRRGA